MRGKRYCKNLRISKKKAACIQAMVALDSERLILPKEITIGFDSAFGLDANIKAFLKSNFSLDLNNFPEGDRLADELLEASFTKEHPVLKLKNGDLIADQVVAYTMVTRQIRSAFGVEINEQISLSDLLPLTADYHAPKHYFSPVFKGESDDVYEGYHLQIESRNPLNPIGSTDVFASESKTTEIKDISITMFANDNPVGLLTATLITVPDIAVFGQHQNSHALKSHEFKHDTAIMFDIENYSADLVDVAHTLISKAKSSLPNNQSRLSSLMRKYIVTDEGDRKKAILVIREVDIEESRKVLFTDIIETVGSVFADHGMYDQDAYGEMAGYNTLIWSSMVNNHDVSEKIDEINESWRLGGLSAVITQQNNQWWQEALMFHKPYESGDLSDALIHVEEVVKPFVDESFSTNESLSKGIEALLMQASVEYDEELVVH